MVICNLFQYEPLATVHPRQLSVNPANEKKKLPQPAPSPPLLDYTKFNRKELINSVKNRQLATNERALEIARSAAKHKQDLEELRRKLEIADKIQDCKNYFEELPAEIRVRIYKYAVPKTYEPRRRPRLHPLCHVSQLVRRETLPIYFSRRPVALYINATSKKWDGQIRASQYDKDTLVNMQQYEALGWIPHMCNFYIKVYGNWFNPVTDNMNFFASKFEIELNGELTQAAISSANTGGKPYYDIDSVGHRFKKSVSRGARILRSTQPSGQRHMTRVMLERYIIQALVRYC